MIKIVTTEASVYIPIAQIKAMFYNRNKKTVKVLYNDDMETQCQKVLMVYLNNEEI